MAMQIKNRKGEVIHEGDRSKTYCDADLRNAVFEGWALQGAHFDDSNLEGASFRGADLYWGNFFLANLTEADFEGAQLRGADLKKTNLTKANLKNANLSRDNVGGSTQLQGANLTEATVGGTNFEGAEYDHETVFPEGFDPKKHKMISKSFHEKAGRCQGTLLLSCFFQSVSIQLSRPCRHPSIRTLW